MEARAQMHHPGMGRGIRGAGRVTHAWVDPGSNVRRDGRLRSDNSKTFYLKPYMTMSLEPSARAISVLHMRPTLSPRVAR